MNIPTTNNRRIDMIDALRGFALFGIIIAHFCNQYYAGMNPPGHENMNIKSGVDGVLQLLHDIFIVGKFYTVFSFLFGVSFGIMMLNAEQRNESFTARFAWRLTILFVVGLINHIHYRGDILTIYACLGFFLLPFRKVSNKSVLFWSFFFMLNIPGVLVHVAAFIGDLLHSSATNNSESSQHSSGSIATQQAMAYYNAIKQGDYVSIIRQNLQAGFADKLGFQVYSGRLFVTFGLFLFGLYMARQKVFEHIYLYKVTIQRWLLGCSIFCFTLIALYAVFGDRLFNTTGLLNLLLTILADLFSPAMSYVYVASFILLWQRNSWQKVFYILVPMGRMGLTSYLTQSIIGLLIFYGYGCNLLDVIGNSMAFLLATGVFIMQLALSHWWMRNFYYGPFEWLWRSATLWEAQRWRK